MNEKGKGEGQVTPKISILVKQRNDGAITGGKQCLGEHEEFNFRDLESQKFAGISREISNR